MSRALLVFVLVVGGCTEVVELLPADARPGVDSPPAPDASLDAGADAPPDASTCVCRYFCRTAADCVTAGVGGSCGGDSYCVNPGISCATTAECSGSLCAESATSTAACP